MKSPTKEQIRELYYSLKDKGNGRRAALALMAESACVSTRSVDNWITGSRNCPPACWKLLQLDFCRE